MSGQNPDASPEPQNNTSMIGTQTGTFIILKKANMLIYSRLHP